MMSIGERKVAVAAYIIVVGILLAVFSTVSDHMPYVIADRSVFELTMYVLGGVFNNLAIWFLLAMIAGYAFGRSWKQSVVIGAILALYAMVLYSVISTATSDYRQGFRLEDLLRMMATWYPASAIGGAIGGLTGFFAQKRNVIWLVPLGFIAVQLVRYGAGIWQHPIDIAQNIILLLVAAGIAAYALKKASDMVHRQPQTNS